MIQPSATTTAIGSSIFGPLFSSNLGVETAQMGVLGLAVLAALATRHEAEQAEIEARLGEARTAIDVEALREPTALGGVTNCRAEQQQKLPAGT